MKRTLAPALTVALICLSIAFPGGAIADMEVRVAIGKAMQSAIFTSDDPIRVTSAGSGALLNTGIVRKIKVRRHKQGVKIDRLIFPVSSIRLSSPGGILRFNGKPYRGQMVLMDTGKSTFNVINYVDLDDYIKSVVPSEVPHDWPIEALKAQAVASRTYALFKRSENNEGNFDLLPDVNDQMYLGMEREKEKTSKAVEATAGMVLMYKNKIARTYYHSTSGPKTESGGAVYKGVNVPYLKSVACTFDRESPYYTWQYNTSLPKIRAALSRHGKRVGAIKSISIRSRNKSGRVKSLGIKTKSGKQSIEATLFRKFIGTTKIKSTRFKIRKKGSKVVFKGIGYGHGVGLCQWGAKGMADRKISFKRILGHYYPGTVLTKDLLSAAE